MEQDNMFSLGDIMENKKSDKKPPAYPWQDLALQVIKELNIPNFKRNSVFKVCKDHPRDLILRCLNDTKELCDAGEKWKYFFKLIKASKNEDVK